MQADGRKVFFQCKGTSFLTSAYRIFVFISSCSLREIFHPGFRFNFHRAVTTTCTFIILLSLSAWNHLGCFLDDIFFDGWQSELIWQPIFIVGNARSGTTWLHRILSDSCPHFTAIKTWEILFAVSITWKLLFLGIFVIDKAFIGGLLFEVIEMVTGRLWRKISMHAIGLSLAEEDDWLMIHIGLSQLIMFVFPLGGHIFNDVVMFEFQGEDPLDVRRERVPCVSFPDFARQDMFCYYRAAVRKHLYFRRRFCPPPINSAAPLVYVSKNPAFTMRIDTLYEYFPDAHVICLWRDPVHSVSSMVSYISAVSASNY